MPSVPPAPPIRGVVFDFHHTLAHAGDPAVWLQQAWADLGRDDTAATGLGQPAHDDAVAFLDQLWEHARAVDPDSERDLDPQRHREVFDRTIGLNEVPDGYRAMAGRKALKVLIKR